MGKRSAKNSVMHKLFQMFDDRCNLILTLSKHKSGCIALPPGRAMRTYFNSTQCKLVWKTLWLHCTISTLVSTSHKIYRLHLFENYSREVSAWRKVLAVINVDTLFGSFGAIMARPFEVNRYFCFSIIS